LIPLSTTCNHYGKKEHILKKQWHKAKASKWVETSDQTTQSESDADSDLWLSTRFRVHHLALLQLEVQGKPLVMEIDTGAAISIISEVTYDALFSQASNCWS